MGVFTFGMAMLAGLLPAAGAIQYLDVQSGWTIEHKGPWQTRADHRDLLAMHHPWIASEAGNFAMAWREVTVPDTWGETVTLHFYCSDDYHGAPRDSLPGTGFTGHRRKQILVNSAPVWTEDVSDAVVPGTAPAQHVTVNVPPENRRIRLTLLAYDAVASGEEAPGDFYRPAQPGVTRDMDPDADRFRTTIYWGDLTLTSGDTPVPERLRPSEALVLQRHNRFWPPKPDTEAWLKERPTLTVSAPAGIPRAGFPVEMGIPLPKGIAHVPGGFRLAEGGDRAFYSQKFVSTTWPDGSIRWVVAQFPLREGTSELSLAFAPDRARPPGTNKLQEENGRVAVDGGEVALRIDVGDPITAVTYRKKTVVDAIRLGVNVAGQAVYGTNYDGQVVDDGPFHTRVLLQGRFEGQESPLGSYALYCSVYHGLPYVKLWFRYFNDTDAAQALSGLDVSFDLTDRPEAVALPHGPAPDQFRLTQMSPDAYSVDGESHPAERPFFFQWSQGALAVRDFSLLHPKGVALAENRVTLSLVAGGDSPVIFTPGEAKSHEIWLALGPTDGAQLAATVARPPLLINSDYYSATGVFGPAAPLPEGHPWAAFLRETYGEKDLRALGMATGVRHYPDDAYLGKPGQWSNNYNGRMESLWMAWLATGDRVWFDHAAAVSRHLMDVAVVHTAVPGRDWLGAIHGPGANHVAGPWNPLLRAEGLALFGQLTGNPEAQEAFLGVADYCVRAGAGRAGPNVRHWAGPFSTLVAAYRDTGEISALEAGSERIAGMIARTDRRRGTWSDWHATSTYPGNIPWMGAQLALPLYTWYVQTGDVEAAQLLVGLAESYVCENTPWEAPGAMRTFSPDPHFPDTTAYDPFIIPMLGAAWELTEDTFFRDAARAQWERWQARPEFQPVFNLSWHMPWLGRVLKDLENATAEGGGE